MRFAAPLFFIVVLSFILGLSNNASAQMVEYPRIEFQAEDALTGMKEHLEEHFKDMYFEVSEKLMLKYSKKIDCIVVANLSEMEHILEKKLNVPITLKDSIAGVAVKSLSLIILNTQAFRNELFLNARKTFKHELAHLMLGSIEVKGTLPTWFEEGLCQWSEQLLFFPTFRDRDLYASLEGAPTIAQIESMMDRRENLDKAYISAFNSVEFLLRNNALSRLPVFYFNFRSNGNFEKSFEQSFSETIPEFEKRWHKQLNPNKPIRIINFIGANWFTLLFGFAGILIIVVYFKRRKIFKRYMKRYEQEDKIEDEEYEDSHRWLREIERRRKNNGIFDAEDDIDEVDPDL